MVLGRVKLSTVDRADDPQMPLLNIEIAPLERQLLRPDTGKGDEPHRRVASSTIRAQADENYLKYTSLTQ